MVDKTISGTAEINSVRLKEQAGDPSTPDSGYVQAYVKSDGLYIIQDDGTVTGPFTENGAGYTEGARVYRSSAQSISSSTETAVQFDNENYDTDTIHDNSTNNTRLTCKTAGKYLIIGFGEFTNNGTGARQVYIRYNAALTTIANQSLPAVSASHPARIIAQTVYDLSVNDYVQLYCYQTSGGALNLTNAWFCMQRIG